MKRSSTARQQIAVPALVSTFCICIVFLPMFFLSGVSRYLFVPLAEAVVFAMLASYLLSRTLVPTLAMYLLKAARASMQHRQTTSLESLSARLSAQIRKRRLQQLCGVRTRACSEHLVSVRTSSSFRYFCCCCL